MKKIPALLLLVSVAAACAGPMGTEPTSPTDATLGVTTQAKPAASLVIETISGDCTSGITVRVTGQNLSGKSRFGQQWIRLSDLTGLRVGPVELGNGSKKSVEWTEFWSAETINPATGPKFSGWASAQVTDNWGAWLHETGYVFVGPAC